MALPPLHDVVRILVTPFDTDGRIDEESLANLVEFSVSAGVHGLGVALGSEIFGAQGGDIFYFLHKQLLVRRGIIRAPMVRGPTTAIDAIISREIDDLLVQLVPTPSSFRRLAV